MKISLDWLREYVRLDESPAQLRQDLSMLGLVVEGISAAGADMVLEVEVTSNRPDCLCHLGIARELAALYGRPLQRPPVKTRLQAKPERVRYSIEIRDGDLCPRYAGLVMDRVEVRPSPDWMQRRLEAAGMRPLNNIVDITNYVLLELGHPLHAFDFLLLRGGKISVARASSGQRMTTLDGVERTLDGEMLLINDAERPVAIGGVMGGLESEISNSTHTVLLECAYFQPASIRRTSKRLGLSTEASYRFERGADWGDAAFVIARTARLIQELAGGRIAGSLQEVSGCPLAPVIVELSRGRAEKLLGLELDDDFVVSTLRSLEFRPSRKGKGRWSVACPTFRADMELEADLIEELARFRGYSHIPTTIPPTHGAGVPNPNRKLESQIRRVLPGLGYSEAVNLSFAAEGAERTFPVPGRARVAIRNPLTDDTGFLRTSLAPGLIESVRRNLNRSANKVMLFELGRVYLCDSNGEARETNALGIIGVSRGQGHNWLSPMDDYGFFHLKGSVEALLGALRAEAPAIEPYESLNWLDPRDASRILVGGKPVGWMGSLHESTRESHKLRPSVLFAELDLDELGPLLFRPVRYSPLPKVPSVERDLSLAVDRAITFAALESAIRSLGIAELSQVGLVDVYEGERVGRGKVGVTIRLTFIDQERTLTVDRVQAFGDSILDCLRNSCGAELR